MTKFKDLAYYTSFLIGGYKLFPFNFLPLDNGQYIATNLVGEHLILQRDQLDALVKHKLDSTSTLYNDLKAKHFLYDSASTVAVDLLTLKQRTKLSSLSDFTGLHMFVVSLRCEHSCSYCQVSRANDDASRSEYDMSQAVAEKACKLAFRSPSPHIKIEFQGGEPLLNFERIVHVVEEAERLNVTEHRNLQFVIATNLALITKQHLEFCKAHDVLISTSLDGPEWLHNQNRPRPGGNSYQKTIEGIQLSRTFLGPDRVGALMTTTQACLNYPVQIIDEYIAQGFREIFLRPISPYGFALKTKSFKSYGHQEWLQFYFKGLEYIVQINLDGYRFVEQYAATILTKMLSPYATSYIDLMSPAGIGIGGVLYNYDGKVYASDEGRMLAEMNDDTFLLGNVLTDSYEEIFTSEALLEPLKASYTKSVPMCADCAFEPYCGADPVYHHATQGDYVGNKSSSGFCQRNMSIFKHLVQWMESDSKVKEVLSSWIRH